MLHCRVALLFIGYTVLCRLFLQIFIKILRDLRAYILGVHIGGGGGGGGGGGSNCRRKKIAPRTANFPKLYLCQIRMHGCTCQCRIIMQFFYELSDIC